MVDRVRARWESGEAVLNAWLTFEGPSSAATIARSGFDAVTLDLQHGTAGIEAVGPVASAIALAGAVPFVRLRWNDPGLVMRALRPGGRGDTAPLIAPRGRGEAPARACRTPRLSSRC